MSDNFIISVSVIVKIVATLAMLFITVMFGVWVNAEIKFKADVIRQLHSIDTSINIMGSSITINEKNITAVEWKLENINKSNLTMHAKYDQSIRNIRYTLSLRGIHVIKDPDAN